MRSYFLSIAFTFLLLSSATGQGKETKTAAIEQIKKVFQQINAYKSYKVVAIDDGEEFLGHSTDNGGSLKGYYKGDILKKIVEWVGLSSEVFQNEYYFVQNKLVFVYSTKSRYHFNSRTQSLEYTKLDVVFKGRYYFDKGELISSIFSDKEHEQTKQKDAADFLVSGEDYSKLLNTKRK